MCLGGDKKIESENLKLMSPQNYDIFQMLVTDF